MRKGSKKAKGISKTDDGGIVVPAIKIERDKLALTLAKSINANFTEFKAAHFIDGTDDEGIPTLITDWISTGDDILDLRISNRPHGGLPVGRITEINGGESSGKSLIIGHLIAETQKKGGIAVLFDTESATSPEFLNAIGVNSSNLVYAQMDTLEDIFAAVEKIIMEVREKDSDRLVFIAIDSIMGSSTKLELEADFDKDGWATGKAIIMSKAMRKITNLIAKQKICFVCTNQLREKLGVMFGDKKTTAGGKALAFHASVGLRLSKLGQIAIGTKQTKEVLGIKTKVVKKNRVGPPMRTSTLNIYFDRGIDRYGNWLDTLKSYGLADVGGKTITIKKLGLDIPKNAWNKTLIENDEVRNKIYDLLCEKLIMKYQTDQTVTIGDVHISTDDEDDSAIDE